MARKLLVLLTLLLLAAGLAARVGAQSGRIQNPYHEFPRWKLWFADPSPVEWPTGRTVQMPPPEKRLYPDDPDPVREPGRFLVFRLKDWPERKYAGMWDDVYSSRDNGHSFIADAWSDKAGNSVRIRQSMICLTGGPIHALGANLTSQSTTGMGHDVANGEDLMRRLEEFFYFADVLVSGPAHLSYMNKKIEGTEDRYEAMSPVFYNSFGHSGSEEMALTKMVIAGAYLPRSLKPRLKTNGIYPSTLLYLWKAGLPYEVPFDHELRHRVAYLSQGDDAASWDDKAPYPPGYDEARHLRNMVGLAKALTAPPPEALVTLLENEGGKTVYALKKTILVLQEGPRPVRLRVSVRESYDLDGRPLTFAWKVLYGSKDTTIRRTDAPDVFEIVAPYDPRLPQGRTSILLLAHNGLSDGNPAVVNVFRARGRPNQRPALSGLEDRVVMPGETVTFDLAGADPEGFPVSFFQRSGEVGRLDGSRFTWRCPPDRPDGEERVTLIASDGTNGNSYNSIRARFHVRSITADILADRESGPAPLAVRFSPLEARDKKGGPLSYRWDFGDGQGSAEPSPAHTFDRAGFFEVALTISGPSGEYTARRVVQARPTWPLLLDNGWRSNGIDPRLWRVQTPGPPVQVKRGVLDLYQKGSDQGVSLTSVPDFTPPFYLETVYTSSPGRKASGFRVLGLHIGLLEDRQARDRVVLAPADLKEREKKPAQEIAALKSSSPCRWLLKLLVDQDPAHPGRIRFQGELTTETGAHFFRLDDQPISGRKLEIMTDSRSAAFEVARFQVWARPENAPGLEAESVPAPSPGPGPAEPDVCAGTPDQEYFRSVTRNRKASARLVALEGNGLAISDGDQEPDPMRHTDFGTAPVRGALARTFTLYNLGPKSLELGGPPPHLKIMGEGAAAFSVAKPPASAIGIYGATTFDLRFQPTTGGRHRAQVVLEYGKSGGRYRFQVQGEGK